MSLKTLSLHLMVSSAFCLALASGGSVSAQTPAVDAENPYHVVTDQASITEARDLYNEWLRKLGINSEVSDCSGVLFALLGTSESVYVAECRINNGRPVIICADTGVGEFGMATLPTDKVRFAKDNCPGG